MSAPSGDDSSTDSDGAQQPFYGPFTGPTMHERRARWSLLSRRIAGATSSGKKRRKVEEAPRQGRYEYEFDEGDPRRWRLDASKSPWWSDLQHPEVDDETSAAGRRFRHKFRLPYAMAMELVNEAQAVKEFRDKPPGEGGGRGPPRHPLVLKVLAVLRHLGKGMDSESLEDAAQISKSTLKVFIPKFLRWMRDVIYPREVRLPTGDHLDRSMKVYEILGFPGAYCSADGVHVPWDRAPSAQHNDYVGKEGYPTVAFVVCVLHSREVIHVDQPLPGGRNDKTHAQHAEIFQKLRQNKLHPERVYYLYNANGKLVEWRGIWAIVDNGFHQWRVLQAPLKHATDEHAAACSKRLESVRKDSECTFGTMKNRFRVLRLPFLCNTMGQIDDTFRACTALHNMLLRHDCYHSIGHRSSDWQAERYERQRADLDKSRMDRTYMRGPDPLLPGVEREPSFLALREAILKHFEMARKKKEVRWLRTAADCRAVSVHGESAEVDGEEGDEANEDEWGVHSEDSE